ncbi:ParB/RepB/Spo0J family partition protein [Streptomyces sp. NRRL B-3648]|uniref:ParB/RepB/Spo0J family partition protein n=1 Tax=Streptomyces sp. NRRL B-3648 TaxID=1519493 RepID=UPI0006AEF665|nr:ParB/RepB/Spo0J family partition protein [Streptomyces sp. NRRL B-3648]
MDYTGDVLAAGVVREIGDEISGEQLGVHHGLIAELSPVESVPVSSIMPGDSPRLDGEDHSHAQILANVEHPLPPIIVHRRSMRVIDGSHRLMAASIKGQETIDVRFFDGPEQLTFLIAVQENVTHGLPLTRADREAAARRVLAAQPLWSDRAVAAVTGLSARTVAALRRTITECSTADPTQLNVRLGRDGRYRPVNYSQGRLRASEVVTAYPEMPLREVARQAGVSVATARDVRQRIQRGVDPLPPKLRLAGQDAGPNREETPDPPADRAAGEQPSVRPRPAPCEAADWSALRAKLLQDPLLRYSESGRTLFRWYDTHTISTQDVAAGVDGVPPHWIKEIAAVARSCGETWLNIARELEGQRQEV